MLTVVVQCIIHRIINFGAQYYSIQPILNWIQTKRVLHLDSIANTIVLLTQMRRLCRNKTYIRINSRGKNQK